MRPAPGELRTHVCVASAANPVACVAACHTFVCCVASVAHTQESDVFHTADCITATRVRTRTPPEMLKAMHFTQSTQSANTVNVEDCTKCEYNAHWTLHKVWTQWTLNIAHGTMRCHSGLWSMSCCTAPRCLTHVWHIVGNRILVWLESWPKWVGYWGRCHVLQWSLQPKCNSYKNTTCTQCQF